MKKNDWLIILFIIITSLFTLKDLFKPGFYTSHDGPHQVVRLYYFDQVLKEGQFPPRWAGGLLNGFGYPLFNFSYHLPWVIAEPFVVFGFSIFDSIKLTFLLGFIVSGIFMYLFQKEMFGRLGAFVGTMIYLYAPYRFSNIFVRAAIGDATTFIFAPLLFWSLYQLKKKGMFNWFWISIGAIATFGLLLSHAMVFLFFLISFVLYVAFHTLFIQNRLKFVLSSLLIVVLGLGLSSYYFIPSLIERSDTKFSEIMSSVYFGNTFLSLNKLLYSSWGYGTVDAYEGAMSLQLGLAQWLVVGLVILLILISLIRRKLNPESLFFFALFSFTIYLILPVSLPFWQIVKNYAFVDFTWRVLPVSIFSVSVLAGFLISKIKYKYLFAFLIVALAFYANRNHLRINQTLDWSIPFYLKLEKTTNSFDEYTPKWVKKEYLGENKTKVEFSDGRAGIEILKNKSNLLEISLNAPESGSVRVNTIYYPGWKVYVDGREEKIDYSNGLIEFQVGEGKKNIVAHLTETPLRLTSDFISLATLVLLFLPFLSIFKKR
jgi:hypothetical protein